MHNLVSLTTIGDGSCFFHAILQAISKRYKPMNNKEKREEVRLLRDALAEMLLIEDNYSKLGRGEIEEIANNVHSMKRENLYRFFKSNEWGGYEILEYVSNILDIDIYVLNARMNVYKTGDKEALLKGRKSIIIRNINNVHFETVGLKLKNGKVKTFFDEKSEVIQKLYLKN